jgi:hypothetical protein
MEILVSVQIEFLKISYLCGPIMVSIFALLRDASPIERAPLSSTRERTEQLCVLSTGNLHWYCCLKK